MERKKRKGKRIRKGVIGRTSSKCKGKGGKGGKGTKKE